MFLFTEELLKTIGLDVSFPPFPQTAIETNSASGTVFATHLFVDHCVLLHVSQRSCFVHARLLSVTGVYGIDV